MANHPYLSFKTRSEESIYPYTGFGEYSDVAAADPGTTVEWVADLGVDITTKKPSKYKVWLVNGGSDVMYVYQGGNPVFAVLGGSIMFEYMDPYGGDLAVIGTAAETFTMFVTGQVMNVPS